MQRREVLVEPRAEPRPQFAQTSRLDRREFLQSIGDLKERPRQKLPGLAAGRGVLARAQDLAQVRRHLGLQEPAEIADQRLRRMRQLRVKKGKHRPLAVLYEVERAAPGKVVAREGRNVTRDLHALLLGLLRVSGGEPGPMLAEADDDRGTGRGRGDGRERLDEPLLVVAWLLLARQRAAQRFMRDDKGRGFALRPGDAGDAPRDQASDTGQTREEVPLKPGGGRLMQADMEVHVVRPEASSAKAAALSLQCDAVRNSDQVGQRQGALPPCQAAAKNR